MASDAKSYGLVVTNFSFSIGFLPPNSSVTGENDPASHGVISDKQHFY